jgi:RND family efflux transporter MFP subunit
MMPSRLALLFLCSVAAIAADAPPALTVSVAPPAAASWVSVVVADGGLAPWQEVSVGSEVGGLRVTAVLVEVGDKVVAGQELARLDTAAIEAQRDAAQAAIAQAEASLELAVADAQRAEGLVGSGVLSEQQIAQYRIAQRTAAAKLASSKADLVGITVKLAQTRIVAADAGVVSARNATLGAVVSAGGELFRLIRQGKVEWQAEVGAKDLLRVQPGQTAHLILADGSALDGKVRAVAPSLSPTTRTGVVYVTLPPESPARAGMFAAGEIAVGTAQPVLTVPATALVTRDGRQIVLTVDAQSAVVATPVVTGRRQGGLVEIRSGLTATARVVTTGAAFLVDGDRVAVAAAPAAQ